MHWKTKALIQNVVARLPSSLSHRVYYAMQRRFGGLRSANPARTIRAAVEIAREIRRHGRHVNDAVFLEVGTGRALTLPIMLWLLGAKRVTTVDLNRYLKAELVAADIAYFQTHSAELEASLAECEMQPERFSELMDCSISHCGLDHFMERCGFQYLAPADAGQLPLGEGSVDFHISTNVFEHIPRAALVSILSEARRVMKNDGLAIHRIDHSDHFSHSDRSLSPINFLQFNERQWSRLAGNRYMYMNRLQVDDFQNIFAESGQEVVRVAAEPDGDMLRELQTASLPLDARFVGKPAATLATMNSLFVSRGRGRVATNTVEQAA